MCVTSSQQYGHVLLEHSGGGGSPPTGEAAINRANSTTAEKSLSAIGGGAVVTGTALAVGIAVGCAVGIRVAVATGIAWLTSTSGVLVLTQAADCTVAVLRCFINC